MTKNFIIPPLIFSCLLITTSANSSGFSWGSDKTYINPAFQIGYSFSKGYFYGFQLSVNQENNDRGQHAITGLTYGYRQYDSEAFGDHYVDFQQSAGGFIGYGLGLNFTKKDDTIELSHYRVKAWAGIIGLVTTDVMIPAKPTQEFEINIGTVGTLPIEVSD